MDKNEIRELMRIFDKSDITKLKIKEGDFSIELQKGFESNVSYASAPAPMMPMPATMPQVAPVAAASAPAMGGEASINAAPSGLNIKSPMVGTFYSRPNPNAKNFVDVGSSVQTDTVVCIIEAMKVFNEIPAEVRGKIVQVLVKNEEAVDYGKPLFKVDTRG